MNEQFLQHKTALLKFKQRMTSGIYKISKNIPDTKTFMPYHASIEGYAFSYIARNGEEVVFICFPDLGPEYTYSHFPIESAKEACIYATVFPEQSNILDDFLIQYDEKYGLGYLI